MWPTGRGKSYLPSALAHKACRRSRVYCMKITAIGESMLLEPALERGRGGIRDDRFGQHA
jgi:hypothetical protein